MRLPKTWSHRAACKIIENLKAKNLIEISIAEKDLIEETEKVIIDELMVEERLNEEVRQILKQYETEIEKGKLDYRKLFEMTKQKIIKERNIII
ncbi:MAG: DUF507 family protein [Thermodesulfovibrionales bacterium]|nr:DUF507 family protein [Thermodesulfovibrionales bacterium]